MHPFLLFSFLLISAWFGLAWHDEPAIHSDQNGFSAEPEQQKKNPHCIHEPVTTIK